MRALTELEIQNEEFLRKNEIHYAEVFMTENILSHHIFDATYSMVKLLKNENVHDYDTQRSGEKTFIKTHLLTFKEEIIMSSSVYKAAKRGDKRMWFGAEILSMTEPGDIILMMAKDGELYILNMSRIDIALCVEMGLDNPIKLFFRSVRNAAAQ